jgi:hypothetical protein
MRWSDIPFQPPSSTLRLFGTFGAALLAGSSCWQFFVHGRPVVAGFLLGAALVVGAVGLMFPMVLRPIFVGWMVLVYPLNWLISHLILGVIYYCIFTPVAVFFKVTGRDALTRRIHPEQESYWTEKHAGAELRSYFRQS